MRVERGHEMGERIKYIGHGKARSRFLGLESLFQRPTRLVAIVAVLAIAFLLAALFFSYGLKLYDDWHQNRLLHRATALLQEARPRRQRTNSWHAVPILYRRFTF